METIGFKNGILIEHKDKYSLYHMFFADFSEFIISIPNEDCQNYKLLIYFDNINFKAENIGTDELVKQTISEKLDRMYNQAPNIICIIPTISKKEFDEIVSENDDKPYQRLLKQLDKIINYAYWTIKNNLIFEDTANIEPQIYIVKQSEEDIKFIWWLELNNNEKYKQIVIPEPIKEAPQENNDTITVVKEVPTPPPLPTPPRRQTMKKPKKPKGDGVHSTGYSNLAFIIMVLTVSLLMGLGIAVLIIK